MFVSPFQLVSIGLKSGDPENFGLKLVVRIFDGSQKEFMSSE
jgi:hypothetical protein